MFYILGDVQNPIHTCMLCNVITHISTMRTERQLFGVVCLRSFWFFFELSVVIVSLERLFLLNATTTIPSFFCFVLHSCCLFVAHTHWNLHIYTVNVVVLSCWALTVRGRLFKAIIALNGRRRVYHETCFLFPSQRNWLHWWLDVRPFRYYNDCKQAVRVAVLSRTK